MKKALEKARKRKDIIDNCIEYEKAYVFGNTNDDNYIGGDHIPRVVMKTDGTLTTLPEVDDKLGKEIKTHTIPQETTITYVEPADYIPKEIRKKYKLGEYADDEG